MVVDPELPSSEYYSGALDARARVRFSLTQTDDGAYLVRPKVRIQTDNNELQKSIFGEFLQALDIEFELVVSEQGADYFVVFSQQSFDRLFQFLNGSSATFVRELRFLRGVFPEEFDTEMSGSELCRFVKTRDELRYGWTPRGPNVVRFDDVTSEYGVAPGQISTPEIPTGSLRTDSSLEYFAGVFDSLTMFRPSVAKQVDRKVGYAIYPYVGMYRAGINPVFKSVISGFLDDRDLSHGSGSEIHTLQISLNSTDTVRECIEALLHELYIQFEPALYLREEILPLHEQDVYDTKQGFYDLLCRYEPLLDTGGRSRKRTYTPAYFEELWSDELEAVAD